MSEVHSCSSQCKLCTANELVWSIRQECTAMPASSATCSEFPDSSWLYQEGLVNTEPQVVKGPIDFLMGDYNNRAMLPFINLTNERDQEALNELYLREPGFLAVVWFGSSPTPFTSHVSKLSLFLNPPVCRRSSLLTVEGVGQEPNHTTVRKPGPL